MTSTPKLSHYEHRIVTATSCTPEQAPRVEEIMRVEHPTLDHLTVQRFDRLARNAYETLKVLVAEGDYYWTS